MVCGVIPNGNNFLHYGYLGEMITGPFVAYGLDSTDKEYLKKNHNSFLHRSTDVTERNLKEIFHEILNQNEYVHQKTNDLHLGSVVTQLNDMKVVDSTADGVLVKKSVRKCIDLGGDVRITFLSMSYFNNFEFKEEFHNFFDLIYFNFTYLKHINGEIIKKIAKEKSLLYVENQRFVLHFRDKELESYKDEVKTKIDGLQCKNIEFNATKDVYFKFLLK